MEVWQRHWWTGNEASLARYDERIRDGRRITLIGGSDTTPRRGRVRRTRMVWAAPPRSHGWMS